MKKILLALGIFLLIFGVVACGNNKDEKKKETAKKNFYDSSLNYEKETINEFNPIWEGSIDKIPKINTFENDYRDQIIENLSTLEVTLDKIKTKINDDSKIKNIKNDYLLHFNEGIDAAKNAAIKLNAQVTSRGAASLDDDKFMVQIEKIKTTMNDEFEKAADIRKKYEYQD